MDSVEGVYGGGGVVLRLGMVWFWFLESRGWWALVGTGVLKSHGPVGAPAGHANGCASPCPVVGQRCIILGGAVLDQRKRFPCSIGCGGALDTALARGYSFSWLRAISSLAAGRIPL